MENKKETLKKMILGDERLMSYLNAALDLHLPDWFIGAGTVRNSIWDILEGFEEHTPLNDIDLVYFDPLNTDKAREEEIQAHLEELFQGTEWEVKNQVRLAGKFHDEPYKNTCDAIAHWVETPTCIGVRLESTGELTICAPHGLDDLMNQTVRINPTWGRPEDYARRREKKQWNKIWPGVTYID